MPDRDPGDDGAAQRQPDDVRPIDAQRVHQADGLVREVHDPVAGLRDAGSPVAADVVPDRPSPAGHDRRDLRRPHALVEAHPGHEERRASRRPHRSPRSARPRTSTTRSIGPRVWQGSRSNVAAMRPIRQTAARGSDRAPLRVYGLSPARGHGLAHAPAASTCGGRPPGLASPEPTPIPGPQPCKAAASRSSGGRVERRRTHRPPRSRRVPGTIPITWPPAQEERDVNRTHRPRLTLALGAALRRGRLAVRHRCRAGRRAPDRARDAGPARVPVLAVHRLRAVLRREGQGLLRGQRPRRHAHDQVRLGRDDPAARGRPVAGGRRHVGRRRSSTRSPRARPIAVTAQLAKVPDDTVPEVAGAADRLPGALRLR